MNRHQRRAQRAYERTHPLTIILPQDISEAAKQELRDEAKSLGIKRVRFTVEK